MVLNKRYGMNWQTVIGLEVHAQLKTNSKLFSSAATAYGAPPNSQTNFIDAGFPGILPVLNQQAVHMAIQFGLAINAVINNNSFFERKNYFYPDLPKGYQISQFQRPIVGEGYLDIETEENHTKKVTIVRAHLEEDAGKLLHETQANYTGVDLNRAGTPLLEIVTAPCLYSAKEAVSYLKTLHQLLRFLNICDGNMQEGSFRCDVNLSLRRLGEEKLGVRTELKNLNSFRFIEKAIYYEEQRHQDLLEAGQSLIQETRLYCPDTNRTQVMRNKENENDYRYFTDPDLLPIEITANDLKHIKENMPLLPAEIKRWLEEEDKLSSVDTEFLLTSPALVALYNDLKTQSHAPAKIIVNWLKGPYIAALNEQNLTFEHQLIATDLLASLLDRLADNVIPTSIAKTIFAALLKKPQPIDALIAASGYEQTTDNTALEKIIRSIIDNHPEQAADYRAGKEKLLSFFVGQVMKQTKGQFDPARVNALVQECLK
jgi:aspartyl-tRNA(Asn)/glutamyl-tRNA(Gln) amidotransferase subunit B